MIRRLAFAALVVVAVIVAAPGAASAHASLDESYPAAGSQVDVSPPAVTLHFTEKPDPGLSSVHVVDSAGNQIEASAASCSAAAVGAVALGLDQARQADTSITNFITTDSGHHIVALWVAVVCTAAAVVAYWLRPLRWLLVVIGATAAATMLVRVEG